MWQYNYLIIPLSICIFVIIIKIILKLTTGLNKSMICLSGKTAIVTGGNSGIGYYTVLHLASRGCRVIIADRDDSTETIEKIQILTNNHNIYWKYIELSSFQSVRQFVQEIKLEEKKLDILINNAGVSMAENIYTDDNLNKTMQINYFGPFLLTYLLIDLLKKSAPSRVIFVSSAMNYLSYLTLANLNYPKYKYFQTFHPILIYNNSKLCNLIGAIGFAKCLKKYNIFVNAVHPGLVKTNILTSASNLGFNVIIKLLFSFIFTLFGKNAEEGAQTILALAMADEDNKNITGKYMADCNLSLLFPPQMWNKKFREQIWKESVRLVGLKEHETIKEDG